jgi:hypothetical protein
MNKQTIAAVVLSFAALIVTSSAKADIISTPEFQSPDSYDFSGPGNFPPAAYQNIGTLDFTAITDIAAGSVTISGTFGNLDYNLTTALSDYYLGDTTGDGEEALEVATCDDASLNCYSGEEGPYAWSLTLDAAQIADLSNGLANGALDFGYTWDQNTPPIPDAIFGDSNGYDPQYVEAGPATLNAYTTPEPATFLFCFLGIAGIVVLRRFRTV